MAANERSSPPPTKQPEVAPAPAAPAPAAPAPTAPAPTTPTPTAFATESVGKALKDSPAAFETDVVLGTGARLSLETPAPRPQPQPSPGPFETDPSERGKKGGGR
jgi:hypothetical protein